MASRQKRISNVRTYFFSPFRHIFKPKTEDLTKKPLTINLLTSYLRQIPFGFMVRKDGLQ